MKTQFNNMNLYMKNVYEKEKKLIQALEKLDSLKIEKPNSIEEIEMLENQKNQLEIEKNEIENKYLNLKEEYSKIKMKLEQVSSKKNRRIEQRNRSLKKN